MAHHTFNRSEFLRALSDMAVFSEKGGQLGELQGTFRFHWEDIVEEGHFGSVFRFKGHTLGGQERPVHGHVLVECGGSDREVLASPRGRVLAEALRVEWSPGENIVGNALADNLPVAKADTLALANLLNMVFAALGRAKIAA